MSNSIQTMSHDWKNVDAAASKEGGALKDDAALKADIKAIIQARLDEEGIEHFDSEADEAKELARMQQEIQARKRINQQDAQNGSGGNTRIIKIKRPR